MEIRHYYEDMEGCLWCGVGDSRDLEEEFGKPYHEDCWRDKLLVEEEEE